MTHTPEAASLANTTLLLKLIQMLGKKGMLTDEEFTEILNNAIETLSSHEQGKEAIAVIHELVKN